MSTPMSAEERAKEFSGLLSRSAHPYVLSVAQLGWLINTIKLAQAQAYEDAEIAAMDAVGSYPVSRNFSKDTQRVMIDAKVDITSRVMEAVREKAAALKDKD